MHPHIGPIPGYLVGWIVAVVLAGGSGVVLLRRAGLSARQITLSIVSVVAATFVAAKLLLFLQAWQYVPTAQGALRAALASAHLSTPGWLLLAIVMSVPIVRLQGLRFLRVADAAIPAAGLLIFGGRIGCFLEGCCFGTPTALPWGVRFPPLSPAYHWQVHHDLIWFNAAGSLPAHALQLYFASFGALLFLGFAAYQVRKRYDGETLLLFSVVYVWGTWVLDHLRAEPHRLTQERELSVAVSLTVLIVTIGCLRRVLPRIWSLRALASPSLR